MATRIDNSGIQVPLTIKQGADFGPIELLFKRADGSAVDLTGATLRGQIRKKALDGGSPVAVFAFSITDAPNGVATMTMSDTVTEALSCGESPNDEASQYTYDIEVVDGVSGLVASPMRGAVTVVREVTR